MVLVLPAEGMMDKVHNFFLRMCNIEYSPSCHVSYDKFARAEVLTWRVAVS